MTRYEITENMLYDDKWIFDHVATVKNYKPSGTISDMKTHNGIEYCRIHTGKIHTVKIHGRRITVQETRVYRRDIKKEEA